MNRQIRWSESIQFPSPHQYLCHRAHASFVFLVLLPSIYPVIFVADYLSLSRLSLSISFTFNACGPICGPLPRFNHHALQSWVYFYFHSGLRYRLCEPRPTLAARPLISHVFTVLVVPFVTSCLIDIRRNKCVSLSSVCTGETPPTKS